MLTATASSAPLAGAWDDARPAPRRVSASGSSASCPRGAGRPLGRRPTFGRHVDHPGVWRASNEPALEIVRRPARTGRSTGGPTPTTGSPDGWDVRPSRQSSARPASADSSRRPSTATRTRPRGPLSRSASPRHAGPVQGRAQPDRPSCRSTEDSTPDHGLGDGWLLPSIERRRARAVHGHGARSDLAETTGGVDPEPAARGRHGLPGRGLGAATRRVPDGRHRARPPRRCSPTSSGRRRRTGQPVRPRRRDRGRAPNPSRFTVRHQRARATASGHLDRRVLRVTKRGYCEHYATTMAILLRRAGHPGPVRRGLPARQARRRRRGARRSGPAGATPGSRSTSPATAGSRSTRPAAARPQLEPIPSAAQPVADGTPRPSLSLEQPARPTIPTRRTAPPAGATRVGDRRHGGTAGRSSSSRSLLLAVVGASRSSPGGAGRAADDARRRVCGRSPRLAAPVRLRAAADADRLRVRRRPRRRAARRPARARRPSPGQGRGGLRPARRSATTGCRPCATRIAASGSRCCAWRSAAATAAAMR